ncbi:MAG: histidine--tRNA ligase [Gammaproteobacteria bacterium]
MKKLQAIRGMNDILPEHTPAWQYLESVFQAVVNRFGYQEIRFPVIEHTELFKRSIGEVTDIVEKEMYSFDDRNGDSLTLRPEGTAGCVRAAEQHGLLYNQQQRLWYAGPMFRHERPQKGRYRQFHQFGVEAFGMVGPDIDAEIIELSAELWRALGLGDRLQLELNNIGSAADRKSFAAELRNYFKQHHDELDEDALRRLDHNPMRILDSKNPAMQGLIAAAPGIADYVNKDSSEHFTQLLALLDQAGIHYQVNQRLVRGLDYYNNCVYEWVTDSLGAQGAVCGGGRYDALVAQLGGRPTPGAGFAIGVERLVLMLETLDLVPESVYRSVDLYLIVPHQDLTGLTQRLASFLRAKFPELGIVCHCGGGKKASQVKRAYASGALMLVGLTRNQDDSLAYEVRGLDRPVELMEAVLNPVQQATQEFVESAAG